jgi:outer membrane immunogenic protein
MKKHLLIGALFACVPGAALAQDTDNTGTRADAFAGPRIEARIGWETPTVSGDGEVYKIGQAVSYGGEVGFDIAAGSNFVVGPYATFEFSGVDVCDDGDCLEIDNNLGLGLQAGLAASPSVLVYAKAGYARMKISATSGGASESESAGGLQGGLGVELALGNSGAYGRLEANYSDYGKFYGINLQRRHVAAAVGFRF